MLCAVDPQIFEAAAQNFVSSAGLSPGIVTPRLYPYMRLTLKFSITISRIVMWVKYSITSDLVVVSANVGTSVCVSCCRLVIRLKSRTHTYFGVEAVSDKLYRSYKLITQQYMANTSVIIVW